MDTAFDADAGRNGSIHDAVKPHVREDSTGYAFRL